ncbi:hypothetical protein CEUSTIGMA_g3739.t1 [Chlamydomonas eustigma]|uniref:Anaphase-promoting complex subunit 4 WD40 domain-containing protein n=1 Tax=Chlamydomonas eustigma TaxID=1157962 RepID=A0A250WZM0_9CHLO|nr:hypothetical protein CEUSTIGMA_g3739.t1 [Chlamydomonas eustigma]|eukprot:GAX76294.1 hypothetical protein CEUSTIGMA_g3739.t1 [Chlamydomonas eustigma]
MICRKNENVTESLVQRELLGNTAFAAKTAITARRLAGLQLDGSRLLKKTHRGAVTGLDLDRAEHRYLLSGSADATVAIFDIQQDQSAVSQSQAPTESAELGEHQPLVFIERLVAGTATFRNRRVTQVPEGDGHRYRVSCVCWYTVDSGLFVTGSYDKTIKVWDTNRQQVTCTFTFTAPVMAAAMSASAANHTLIAGACQHRDVLLCDLGSGAFSHTLAGHRESVCSLAWSLRNEFEIVTGDSCGQVRVWDLRRPGCLHILDMNCTTKKAAAWQQQRQQQDVADAAAGRRRPSATASAYDSGGRDASGDALSSESTHIVREMVPTTHIPGSQGSTRQRLKNMPSISKDAGVLLTHVRPTKRAKGDDAGLASLPDVFQQSGSSLLSLKSHDSAVLAVMPTPDGLHWLTLGSEGRLRQWDALTWHNRLVSYPSLRLTSNPASHVISGSSTIIKTKQLAVTPDARALFCPTAGSVQVINVHTGRLNSELQQGHFGGVTCCIFDQGTDSVVSGGEDGQVLFWSTPEED